MIKKIILLGLFLVIIAVGTKFAANFCIQTLASEYGQEETTVDENTDPSTLEIINKINQLGDDYNSYIVKNFDKISKNYPKNTKVQDKLFSEHLRQISEYSKNLYLDNINTLLYENPIENGELVVNKDNVSYRLKFNKKNDFISGDFFNTSCPVLKIIHTGEGELGAGINYNYLSNSKNMLGTTMQEYLNLRVKEDNTLNNNALYLGAGEVSVPMSMLTEWIIMWQKFLEEYPKFYLRDVISRDIQTYTYYFATYDYYPGNEVVSNDTKKAYEDFLKKVNPKTESYVFIKRCYDMLKMNDFKYTNNNLYFKEISNYQSKYNLPERF